MKSKPSSTPTRENYNASDRPSRDESEENEVEEEEEEDEDDDDDPGTSWFTEHNAPDKVLSFLTSSDFPLAPCNTFSASESKLAAAASSQDGPNPKEDQQPAILDLGTGNGSMLALLRTKGGFRGDMVGVDYSERSIVLARELQQLKAHSAYWNDSDSDSSSHRGSNPEGEEKVVADGGKGIRFEVWDILASDGDFSSRDPGKRLDWFPYDKGGFDIVLDKGTFDAVSLSDEHDPGSGERVCERYPGIARGLVRRGGFLVVTSCNWTEEELVQWFVGDHDDEMSVWGRVEYPRFRFGGHEGQGVCTVCFQRK